LGIKGVLGLATSTPLGETAYPQIDTSIAAARVTQTALRIFLESNPKHQDATIRQMKTRMHDAAMRHTGRPEDTNKLAKKPSPKIRKPEPNLLWMRLGGGIVTREANEDMKEQPLMAESNKRVKMSHSSATAIAPNTLMSKSLDTREDCTPEEMYWAEATALTYSMREDAHMRQLFQCHKSPFQINTLTKNVPRGTLVHFCTLFGIARARDNSRSAVSPTYFRTCPAIASAGW
jgi:hypothetical protein